MIDSHEESHDLPMQRTHAGGWAFFTEGYGLKTYTLNLEYLYQVDQKSIGTTSFTVKDGTPPEVVILSPVPDSYFNSTLQIAALATENTIGIWLIGDGNTMHNGSAEGNRGVGILVEGNDNLITNADAMANGGHGIQVFGRP